MILKLPAGPKTIAFGDLDGGDVFTIPSNTGNPMMKIPSIFSEKGLMFNAVSLHSGMLYSHYEEVRVIPHPKAFLTLE